MPVKKEEKHVKKEVLRYKEAVGRRKTAIARVRIVNGKGKFVVNTKDLKDYFSLPRLRGIAVGAFQKMNLADSFDVQAHVRGGGARAQAEAIRHGISRALVLTDVELKKRLKKFGYLTRDPRMVERKKYGLRKARRAPQWAKR